MSVRQADIFGFGSTRCGDGSVIQHPGSSRGWRGSSAALDLSFFDGFLHAGLCSDDKGGGAILLIPSDSGPNAGEDLPSSTETLEGGGRMCVSSCRRELLTIGFIPSRGRICQRNPNRSWSEMLAKRGSLGALTGYHFNMARL